MDDSALLEERLDSQQLLDGKLLKVYADTVRLPDGREGRREWIRHPGAVAVIAHRRECDRVVLVRQFRYPIGKAVWELPAGKLDPGESVEACGRRELLEETGWLAGELRPALPFLPCIGYSNEIIHILYTHALSPGQAALDAGEFLQVVEFSLEDLRRMLDAGEIEDAKTMLGLYWLFRQLEKGVAL